MSYVGNTPTQQAFSPAIDYFSGNGSTVAFTLSRPVASVAQVQVTVNNVPQNPSTAFTVSGQTLTFTGTPSSGTNNIYVQYTSPITQVIAPGQSTVNTLQLVDDSVTTAKILNANVTSAKLASGAALANIGAAGVTQSYLGAGVAGNGPAFSAYQSTAQTGITTAWTKISLQTELFDTNNNFDKDTNYRFQPTVAGYYMFVGNIYFTTSGINNYIAIYKNGSAIVYGTAYPTGAGGSNPYSSVSTFAYMNGTTDYVELWGYATNTWSTGTGIPSTYLQGFLARAA
jgi:hypothetical protein